MKINPTDRVYKNNRRNFLKSQVILAVGATISGIAIPEAYSEPTEPRIAPALSADQMRDKYQQCLGGPFPDPIPMNIQVREIIQKDGYRIESLTYEAQSGIMIPALLMVPDKVTALNPAPAIAVWHQHNGAYNIGKTEPAGLGGNPMHHTGLALVREGYVVICPDALCFGERQDPMSKLKDSAYERFEFLREVVRGRSMAWRNILEMKRAVDVLCSRPEVNADRLGCYGHSMGSTHSWLVGPLEPRLKCIVGNCCLPTYDAIEEAHYLHCMPNYVPGWRNFGDTPDIVALIAPRALHLNFGENDSGSPIVAVRKGVQRIAEAFLRAGVPENFTAFIQPDTGHVLSELMWQQTKNCFDKHLKN
ncbi:MAG: alpha/beta hydrolase family protein [Mariniphaga sp.]